jgi:hypothetical protein
MRKRLIVFILFFYGVNIFAQTGIGTTTPDASAKLEVASTNKGFLPPRVALTATNSASPITSPATGLLIFNTASAGTIPNQVSPGYYYWDGVNSKWVRFEDKADNLGNHTASSNILLNGNYLSNDGGNNGIRVDNSGNVGIGTNTPTAKLNIAGGGVRIASGLGNTSSRPSVNTSTIGNYEIRGVGGGASQIDGQDDGFLRLSAGGGTNAFQQSSIDLSGYSATVPDMNSTIVMRTAGTERVRIDNSGNVNVTGKLNVSDAGGGVAVKAAGFVDAGTFVTLDNLKATVTTSSTRGLSLATVTGTLNLYVQGVYTNQAGAANTSYTNAPVAYTTTASGSMFGWHFGEAGNTIIYHLTDATNSRLYRVTLIIMPSFLKNFISIERLL